MTKPTKLNRKAPLNIDELRAFAAVARTQSQSLAARELGVSASTISRRIDRVRENFGDGLFVQSTSGELTDRGAKVAEACQVAVAELDRAREHLSREQPLLKLGFTRMMGPVLEVALGMQSNREDSLVQYAIRTYERTSERQFREFNLRELDMVVCFAQEGAKSRSDLREYLVVESPYTLVVPEHAWIDGALCREALAPLDYVHVRRPSVVAAGDLWLRRQNLEPKHRLAHDMASEILTHIGSGRGYALLPRLWKFSTRSRARFVDVDGLNASARIVTYAHSAKGNLARALRDRLRNAIEALESSRR